MMVKALLTTPGDRPVPLLGYDHLSRARIGYGQCHRIPIGWKYTARRREVVQHCGRMQRKQDRQVSSLEEKARQETVLIVDGTNVLSRAYNTSKSLGRMQAHSILPKPREVFGLWMDYLAGFVEADIIMCVFDHPDNVSLGVGGYKKRNRAQQDDEKKKRRGGRLWEYQEYFNGKGATWHMTLSLPGEEADRCIMKLTRRLIDSKRGFKIVVASGDTDMQGVIDVTVSWLEILPFPKRQALSGLVMHTLDDFVWKDYFHPSKYGTFLALVGKRGGGMGMSETTAAKLIRSFGDVDSMYRACEQGRMKSWDTRVQKVFDTSHDSFKKLEENRKIFEFQSNGSDADMDWIDTVPDTMQKTYTDGARHPFIEMHWSCVEENAKICLEPLESLCRICWKPSLGNGLYADASIQTCDKGNILYIIFIAGKNFWRGKPCKDIAYDILIGSTDSAWHDPCSMQKQCDSSMAKYLKLVKGSGHNVVLLPSPSANVTGL